MRNLKQKHSTTRRSEKSFNSSTSFNIISYCLIYLNPAASSSFFRCFREVSGKKHRKHPSTATCLCGHFLRLPPGGTLRPSLPPQSQRHHFGNESDGNLIGIHGMLLRNHFHPFHPCSSMLISHRHQLVLIRGRSESHWITLVWPSVATTSGHINHMSSGQNYMLNLMPLTN